MFGAARNILKREFDANCRARGIDPLQSTVQDAGTSVTQIVAKRREHRLLLLALQRIPMRYQVLLELYVYGLPQTEIAQITEEPAKTIRNTLFHARKKLREAVRSLETDPALQKATLDDLRKAFEQPGGESRRALYYELVHGEMPSPSAS